MAQVISPTLIWTTMGQRLTSASVRRKQKGVADSIGGEELILGTQAAVGTSVELTPGLRILQIHSLGLLRNPHPIPQTVTLGHLAGTRKTRRRLLPAGLTLGTSVHLMKRKRTNRKRKTKREATTIGQTSRPLERRRKNRRRRMPSTISPTTRIQTPLVQPLRIPNPLPRTHGTPGELPLPRRRRARRAKRRCLRHRLQLQLCMHL